MQSVTTTSSARIDGATAVSLASGPKQHAVIKRKNIIRIILPYMIYLEVFFVNLSYKLSGTYNLVNQVSQKNMFCQKQIK